MNEPREWAKETTEAHKVCAAVRDAIQKYMKTNDPEDWKKVVEAQQAHSRFYKIDPETGDSLEK